MTKFTEYKGIISNINSIQMIPTKGNGRHHLFLLLLFHRNTYDSYCAFIYGNYANELFHDSGGIRRLIPYVKHKFQIYVFRILNLMIILNFQLPP